MTNCPELLLHMLCDSGLSAVQPVLDTDKQTCMHGGVAYACVEGGSMACLQNNQQPRPPLYIHTQYMCAYHVCPSITASSAMHTSRAV